MLTLYPDEDCSRCRALAARLKEEHLAHRIQPAEGSDAPAHSLRDGDGLATGHPQIEAKVDERARLQQLAQRYPSDLCFDYGDEDGCEACG
jgi:predicted DCC family thiol-disulfide oxidoreductase YuxK